MLDTIQICRSSVYITHHLLAGMAQYTYHGVAFKQTPSSPWMFSFAAEAEELLEWAHIPRRVDSMAGGFQRPVIDKNLERLSQFFQADSNNVSPTSLTAGFLPGSVSVSYEQEDVDNDAKIRRAKIVIEYDENEDLDIVIQRVTDRIESRLTSEEESEAEEEEESEAEEEEESEAEEEEEEEDTDGESVLPDFSQESELRELLEKVQDEEWLTDSDNEEFLRDFSKPCVLIDGQHRTLSAASLAQEIPFACVALLDAEWAELVFQFAIINKLQQKVKNEFITANAAMSLTDSELLSLGNRMRHAGTGLDDVEWFNANQNSSTSPFKGMIATGTGNDANKLAYKEMQGLAKKWWNAPKKRWSEFLKLKYPSIPKAQDRKKQWQESGDWMVEYHRFWNAVYEHVGSISHNGSNLWNVGNGHLMKSGTLVALQDAFFSKLDDVYDTLKSQEMDPFSGEVDQYYPHQIQLFIVKRKKNLGRFLCHETWPSPIVGDNRRRVEDIFVKIMDKKQSNYHKMEGFKTT